MKLDISNAAQIFRPTPTPTTAPSQPQTARALPEDIFKPAGPSLEDGFYKFGLSRKGSEDLEAEAAKQQANAAAALAQFPPDLKAYGDAKRKLAAIEAEQNGRANEQRFFELGLRLQDDAGLQKSYDTATAELEKVTNDPMASEADRERARARLQAVLAEMERRD